MKKVLIILVLTISQAHALDVGGFFKKASGQVTNRFASVPVKWSCSIGTNDSRVDLPESADVQIKMNPLGDVNFKPDIFKTNKSLGNIFKSIFGKPKVLGNPAYLPCIEKFLKDVEVVVDQYKAAQCLDARSLDPICRKPVSEVVEKAKARALKTDFLKLPVAPPIKEPAVTTSVPAPKTADQLEQIAQVANRLNSEVSLGPVVDGCTDALPGRLKVRRCPPSNVSRADARTLDELLPILRENNIHLASEKIDPKYVEDFLVEFYKFPEILRVQLRKKVKINLIQGNSIADDTRDKSANMDSKLAATGRTIHDIPGSGGNSSEPTRIVINHLHDNHGSSNLFLHEHGHALEAIYGKLSSKKRWKEIFENPKHREFFRMLCVTDDYCVKYRDEAFAESFAYFNACPATRHQMEEAAPDIALYFRDMLESSAQK